MPKEGESLKEMAVFRLVLTVFYSFSDVAAFLGPRLATIVADHLRAGKCLRIVKNGWVTLPYIIVETIDGKSEAVDRKLMVSIRDLFGLDYESLQNTAAAYNVHMPAKDLMDKYKKCMDRAYIERRDTMIEYALGDLVLADLWDAYERNYEQLCELFQVTPKFPPPATKGSFVATLFAQVLAERLALPEDFDAIFDVKRTKSYRRRSKPTCREEGSDAPPKNSSVIKSAATSRKFFTASPLLKLYGCKALAQSDRELTKRFLAIVHGGRVKNENPLKIRHDGLVMSMDLVSCYGKALQYLSVPVGHPSLFYYPQRRPSEWPTLGEFLKKYRDQLVEGAWYMVIQTYEPLSFSQTLIYSKLFPSDDPELTTDGKAGDDFREDLATIKGDFVLLEQEIVNGILTHYSLSLIEHCASDQELGELMRKIRVKAAMIYTRDNKHTYNVGDDSSFFAKGSKPTLESSPTCRLEGESADMENAPGAPECVRNWLEKARLRDGKLTTSCVPKTHTSEDDRPGP